MATAAPLQQPQQNNENAEENAAATNITASTTTANSNNNDGNATNNGTTRTRFYLERGRVQVRELANQIADGNPRFGVVRDRLFHAMLTRISLPYHTNVPPLARKLIEFLTLVNALTLLSVLIYVHFLVANYPAQCLDGVKHNWPHKGIVRVEVIRNLEEYRQMLARKENAKNNDASSSSSNKSCHFDLAQILQRGGQLPAEIQLHFKQHSSASQQHEQFAENLDEAMIAAKQQQQKRRKKKLLVGGRSRGQGGDGERRSNGILSFPSWTNMLIHIFQPSFERLYQHALSISSLFWPADEDKEQIADGKEEELTGKGSDEQLVNNENDSDDGTGDEKEMDVPLKEDADGNSLEEGDHNENGEGDDDDEHFPLYYHLFEFSLHYGLLRLNADIRHSLNIETLVVQLDAEKDVCFQRWRRQPFMRFLIGIDELVMSSVKQLSENETDRGYLRDLIGGELYHFINVGKHSASEYITALTIMLIFTFAISMLLRFSHDQIFVFIVDLFQMFEQQQPLIFPIGPLLTVILALVGMEAIMSEIFNDTSTAFYVILLVWSADQYDAIFCHSSIGRRYWLRFFYLYHFAFYAYQYHYNGLYNELALLTSAAFILHSMVFFYHHYELPYLLYQQQLVAAAQHFDHGENADGTVDVVRMRIRMSGDNNTVQRNIIGPLLGVPEGEDLMEHLSGAEDSPLRTAIQAVLSGQLSQASGRLNLSASNSNNNNVAVERTADAATETAQEHQQLSNNRPNNTTTTTNSAVTTTAIMPTTTASIIEMAIPPQLEPEPMHLLRRGATRTIRPRTATTAAAMSRTTTTTSTVVEEAVADTLVEEAMRDYERTLMMQSGGIGGGGNGRRNEEGGGI